MDDKKKHLAHELYRNLRILAVLTVVFLLTLALAPFKWSKSEWRDVQKRYNRAARAAGLEPVEVSLKQIWRPEVELVDRCVTCHLGMGPATPLNDGEALFAAHPEVGHQVSRMGCTICHRGQGRATTADDAHGRVRHWEDPMLDRAHLEASCGGCHGDAVVTPAVDKVEHGAYLFELHGCQACHTVDSQGGSVGPDLSGVALKGFDREWHVRHLRDPGSLVEGSKMMSFGHLSDREIDDLLAYLDTLIGAPKLVRGKAIAVALGCRGCHKIGGLGGDTSIDLNEAAKKPAVDYDFSHVEGEATLVSWHREHLRDPRKVAPGSTMPPYRLDEDDEDALLTFILSLRRPEVPFEELPRATILARLEERRDFVHDGEVLYGAFCAACHGPDGDGQVMASLGTTVPGLRNPEVWAILSDESLRWVLEHGRPGRFMPSWTTAGLTDAELDAITAFLRRDLPEPPSFAEVEAARADVAFGGRTFAQDCAACHGGRGEGTVIGPSLTSPELHFAADDRYFYTMITHGRPGTAMPAHRAYDARTLKSLIAWLRLEAADGLEARRGRMRAVVTETLFVDDLGSYRASGSPAYGETLFRTLCVGCHGPQGRGGLGPAIANPHFLAAASDGFLAGTILLGRSQRAMQSFGPHGLAAIEGRQVGDLVVYLRQLGNTPPEKPGFRTVQGTPEHGAELYGSYCVGCHGEDGRGRTAPALSNPAFLDAVSDGFLQATLVRGRPGTAMRSWARGGYGFAELEPEDLNDIVAHIRSWQSE